MLPMKSLIFVLLTDLCSYRFAHAFQTYTELCSTGLTSIENLLNIPAGGESSSLSYDRLDRGEINYIDDEGEETTGKVFVFILICKRKHTVISKNGRFTSS